MLWIVAESSQALPDCGELQALSKSAQEKCHPAVTRVMEALEKASGNPGGVLPVLYGMLALRDDAGLRTTAVELIARAVGHQPEFAAFPTLAKSLTAKVAQIDRAALDKLIAGENGPISGDDPVVLTALAARRAGGDAWQAFRIRMPDLLRDQPLSGYVVVLLSRLANPALPLVVSRS